MEEFIVDPLCCPWKRGKKAGRCSGVGRKRMGMGRRAYKEEVVRE
jgi:hypothetical protein